MKFMTAAHHGYNCLEATATQGLKNLGHEVYGQKGNANK